MTSGRYELHCHLDGSVRPDTIADLAVEAGIELAGPVRARAVAPPDVGSLHAFLSYLDVALDVLQTPSALRRAARELVEDWYADGVAYGEARFAPQLHGRLGMSVDEAVTAVAAGLREGHAATGVRTALLLCCLRHQSPEVSLRVADAAVRFARPANSALETCPRCNVLTRAVKDLTAHPVDRLLRAGLRVTVSTDGRTTADTTLEQEFADLRRVFGWTAEQEARCRVNAAEAAFAARGPLA